MPRYSYECHSCKSIFDAVHHHQQILQECTFCESEDIKRIISKVYLHKKTTTDDAAGNKVKETIAETIEEMKKYKKHSTRERDHK
jgi:putative FmdB family regulatory protein